MTKPLSPAAAAVWKAFEHADCDPYLVDPREASLAAALRAAADQVVPKGVAPHWDTNVDWAKWRARDDVHDQLLAIAAELEGGQ